MSRCGTCVRFHAEDRTCRLDPPQLVAGDIWRHPPVTAEHWCARHRSAEASGSGSSDADPNQMFDGEIP